MSAIRAALLLLCLALLAPSPAEAARSAWSETGEAQLRLLALPFADGGLAGGIEIAMSPGWHTYWRNPGEAGIPPQFDFSASENVGSVEVSYPAPERLDDGASVSVIYSDQVVFPIRIIPQDAAKPVTLRLSARFGVCREVCIPVETEAQLAVPPDAADDPLARAILVRAAAKVPGPPAPGAFDIRSVTLETPDTLAIEVTMPDSSYVDLFVDAPPDWLIGQPEFVGRDGAVARYQLSLKGRPAGASASGQLFRFVAVAGSAAIEQIVRSP